jgi:integrase
MGRGTLPGPEEDHEDLMQKSWERYFRFHALRHLGVSILDRENVNLGAIQGPLGHENRTTTETTFIPLGKPSVRRRKSLKKRDEESHTSPTQPQKERVKRKRKHLVTPYNSWI